MPKSRPLLFVPRLGWCHPPKRQRRRRANKAFGFPRYHFLKSKCPPRWPIPQIGGCPRRPITMLHNSIISGIATEIPLGERRRSAVRWRRPSENTRRKLIMGKSTDTQREADRPAPTCSQPRLFYHTNAGKKCYLDSPESEIKREDVINWSDDGQIGVLKNGNVCF